MGFLDNLQTILGMKTVPGTSADQSSAAQNSPQKKVLIVEDDEILANALALKLTHEGFAVLKAQNGQIGLNMIQTNKPDVVLLDLMMPVMDGKTMLRKVREIPQFKYLPVVVLTNAGEVDNIRETKEYDNASAFLIKANINPEDVVNMVKELTQR